MEGVIVSPATARGTQHLPTTLPAVAIIDTRPAHRRSAHVKVSLLRVFGGWWDGLVGRKDAKAKWQGVGHRRFVKPFEAARSCRHWSNLSRWQQRLSEAFAGPAYRHQLRLTV